MQTALEWVLPSPELLAINVTEGEEFTSQQQDIVLKWWQSINRLHSTNRGVSLYDQIFVGLSVTGQLRAMCLLAFCFSKAPPLSRDALFEQTASIANMTRSMSKQFPIWAAT